CWSAATRSASSPAATSPRRSGGASPSPSSRPTSGRAPRSTSTSAARRPPGGSSASRSSPAGSPRRRAMGHYVPHTDEEIEAMLASIGLSSLDELFDVVPAALRLAGGLDLPAGLPEYEVADEMARLAAANRSDLVCFAG